MTSYGLLDLEDSFFIDSVDARMYRAISYIFSAKKSSPSSVYSKSKSILKPLSFYSTPADVANVVLTNIFQRFGQGDIIKRAVWEAYLMNNGVSKIIFANRTYENAVRLANDFHGVAISFDLLVEKLREVDIIISSTGASGYVITEEMVIEALRRRKNRLIFIIDIAVPRDVAPTVEEIDNVYLNNIDNLQENVDENLRSRMGEAEKAEKIIAEEIVNFASWLNTLKVVPAIVSLRKKAENIIEGELEKSLSWMRNLNEDEKEKIKILASSIVNKILHDPITSLKDESQNSGADPYVAAIMKLFRLEEEE